MAGIDAFGTTLEMDTNDDAFATGVTVGEIVTLNPLSVTAEDYDVTTHGSPNRWREYLGGLKDGGELSATVRFDPALHGSSMVDELAVTHDIRVTFNVDAGGVIVTFPGYLKGVSADAPHDGPYEGEITIKVAGEPVFT